MNNSLVGLNKNELSDILLSMGISEKKLNMRSNQIWNWIYVRGAKSIDEMTNLSKEFRQELSVKYDLTRPEITKNEISSDGTQKWLIKFPDNSEDTAFSRYVEISTFSPLPVAPRSSTPATSFANLTHLVQ